MAVRGAQGAEDGVHQQQVSLMIFLSNGANSFCTVYTCITSGKCSGVHHSANLPQSPLKHIFPFFFPGIALF